ncbi:MAG: type II toxin-antitoxin system RelE/ParE family toxin [Chitinophagaceae bacterium]|nr:type II toxin-antitoxin system RelE/ParE family toxin [Chitinophagaceae bacterium]
MPYHVSKAAKNDLENIWQYTVNNWSTEQADRYVSLILEELKFLGEHPETGKNYDHVRKNYRSSRVKSHIIFYKPTGKNSPIEIIRILHQGMDILKHLLK